MSVHTPPTNILHPRSRHLLAAAALPRRQDRNYSRPGRPGKCCTRPAGRRFFFFFSGEAKKKKKSKNKSGKTIRAGDVHKLLREYPRHDASRMLIGRAVDELPLCNRFVIFTRLLKVLSEHNTDTEVNIDNVRWKKKTTKIKYNTYWYRRRRRWLPGVND